MLEREKMTPFVNIFDILFPFGIDIVGKRVEHLIAFDEGERFLISWVSCER